MRERREKEREIGKNESEDNPRTAGIQKRNTFASQDKKVGRKESEIKSKAFVRLVLPRVEMREQNRTEQKEKRREEKREK